MSVAFVAFKASAFEGRSIFVLRAFSVAIAVVLPRTAEVDVFANLAIAFKASFAFASERAVCVGASRMGGTVMFTGCAFVDILAIPPIRRFITFSALAFETADSVRALCVLSAVVSFFWRTRQCHCR